MGATISYNGATIATIENGHSGTLPKTAKPQTNVEIQFDGDGSITYCGKITNIVKGKLARLLCKDKLLAEDVVINVKKPYTVSGVWVFNEVLVALTENERDPYRVDQAFANRFVSNKISYERMTFSRGFSGNEPPSLMLAYERGGNYNGQVAYYTRYTPPWWDTNYRTVNFGATEQVVSQEFYEFLVANAKPQENVLPNSGVNVNTREITDTWEQIQIAIGYGIHSTRYAVGDTKTMTTTDGKEIVMQIVAFDADEKTDGRSKAAISWISKDIVALHFMNNSATNEGGWEMSALRNVRLAEIYNTLPTVVKSNIIPVYKSYAVYNSGYLITMNCVDTLWIPSDREMFNGDPFADFREDSGVDYTSFFTTSESRIKRYYGADTAWWVRSASMSTSNFTTVVKGGGRGSSTAALVNGVVLGFCM